jgi:hypothetical protein
MATDKQTLTQFPVKLDDEDNELLTAAAARHGLSKQAYAQRLIRSGMLQDAALEYAAECLEKYGAAFGLDPEGNAAKVAELRAGDRLAA